LIDDWHHTHMQSGHTTMQNGCQLAFVPKYFGITAPSATAEMLEHIQLCSKINNSVSFDVLSTNDSN